MNDLQIRDLLHDVADDVEPGDRLDAIRAATSPGVRRPGRAWWVGGGAGLVAASAVAALVLSTGGAPQSDGRGPAGQPTASATVPSGEPTDSGMRSDVVGVYYVSDTSAGQRLFREFHPRVDRGDPALKALRAAVEGDALDGDYRSTWPRGSSVRGVERMMDGIFVDLGNVSSTRPGGTDEEDAELAVEQLVRTAQAVYGLGKLPVHLLLDGAESDEVLGVATALPLTGAPDADVLAPVSLSEPSEGRVVKADQFVTIEGRAVSADGMVTVRVQRWQGTAVALGPATVTLSPDDGPFESFSVDLASFKLQPGDYDVIATIQNPDGTVDSDTRRITVVD